MRVTSSRRVGNSGRRAGAGLTLIETTVAIAVTSIIAGAMISALLAVKQADRGTSRSTSRHNELVRLAERIHEDVHQAAAVAWDAEQGLLKLEQSDGSSIQYQLDVDGASRRESILGAPTKPTRYRVKFDQPWNVEPTQAISGELVTIVLGNVAHGVEQSGRAAGTDKSAKLSVTAVTGRCPTMEDLP